MKKQVREILQTIPWLAVFFILLAGILASIGIYCFCKESRNGEKVSAQSQMQSQTHRVTFFREDGSILEEKTVAHGESVMPPVLTSGKDAVVFRGWTINLSSITRDTEARPLFQDLTNEKNVFYMDTRYEESGQDIMVELKLGGRVNLSGIKLTLTYDPEVLKLLESESALDGVEVSKTEDGILEIIIDSEENLTEPTQVLCMKYHVEDVDFILAYLDVSMKEPRRMDGGAMVGTDSTAVNGKIYIY